MTALVTTDLNALQDRLQDRIQASKTQIFFVGGHGGLVTYDGDGGPMVKDGGPMDRVYVLRSEGELGGDHGLDIEYGNIAISTGSLAHDMTTGVDAVGDTCWRLSFDANPRPDGVKIVGGVRELGLPFDTVLFRGNVESSDMDWIMGDVSGRPPRLPYTGFHTDFALHPVVAARLGLPAQFAGVGISAWCKIAVTPPADVIAAAPPKAAPFRTQQHLGTLRLVVFDG